MSGDVITYEDVLRVAKLMDEADAGDIIPAIFHPECVFEEFGGRTLQQVKDDGELPENIILQRELPLI